MSVVEERLESAIQKDIKAFLEDRGWTVMVTHGNAVQEGFPDLYCVHPKYGQRWVEVKNPKGYSFTKAQLKYFPKINNANIPIYVMFEASNKEYAQLFIEKYKRKGTWIQAYTALRLLGPSNRKYKITQ
jgi:hypothetical protein